MSTENKSPRDRHRAGMVQLKTWVPSNLKNEFASVCALQGLCASVVLRGLLAAYILRASGAPDGQTAQR